MANMYALEIETPLDQGDQGHRSGRAMANMYALEVETPFDQGDQGHRRWRKSFAGLLAVAGLLVAVGVVKLWQAQATEGQTGSAVKRASPVFRKSNQIVAADAQPVDPPPVPVEPLDEVTSGTVLDVKQDALIDPPPAISTEVTSGKVWDVEQDALIDLPPAFSTEAKHYGYFCNGCGVQTIVGNRYHSMTRVNYDLCQTCYDRRNKQDDPDDTFKVIANPPEAHLVIAAKSDLVGWCEKSFQEMNDQFHYKPFADLATKGFDKDSTYTFFSCKYEDTSAECGSVVVSGVHWYDATSVCALPWSLIPDSIPAKKRFYRDWYNKDRRCVYGERLYIALDAEGCAMIKEHSSGDMPHAWSSDSKALEAKRKAADEQIAAMNR